jgi:hypothetical protein
MSKQSPFVVDSLRPDRIGGGGGIYQLNEYSVNQTVTTGVDDAGLPVEETIPAAYHKKFVMPDGGINTVPLRTAAVFSMEPEAERYEHMVTRDIIRAGAIPIEACAYSYKYAHLKNGQPFVKIPDGAVDCGGRPDAHSLETCCPHLQAVIKSRRALSLAKYQKQEQSVSSMKTSDVERLTEMTAKAFGQAMATHFPDGSKAKQKLHGKGEEG